MLVDLQLAHWALELAKQLMLNDDEYGADPVDYTMIGWCMVQVRAPSLERAVWAHVQACHAPHLCVCVCACGSFCKRLLS